MKSNVKTLFFLLRNNFVFYKGFVIIVAKVGRKMYKLIALDLDGTLTDKNKNILEETKQELIKLAQKVLLLF